MRLVDADALLANRQILRGQDVIGIRDYVTVAEIENAPTIEPEQPEIIRCKDCKWYVYGDDEEEYYCCNSGIGELETFYCADAERREDG